MSLAKVTYDSLVLLAEKLKKCADDILADKTQLDNQLGSFLWEDPVGVGFYNKYEEGFAPIQNKLIPNIDSFVQYIHNLKNQVDEYSGATLAAGGVGVAAAGAAIGSKPSVKRDGVVSSRVLAGAPKKKVDYLIREGIISDDEDPANVDLTQEEYDRVIQSDEYKKRYKAYLTELRRRHQNLREVSETDIDEINSAVFHLKEDELKVEYKHLGQSTSLGGQATGEVASINLDYDSRQKSSLGGFAALGAHESTHARQWKIYQKIYEKSQDPSAVLTSNERRILSSYPKFFRGWSQGYHDSAEEVDARISQYAFRDAWNKYALESIK